MKLTRHLPNALTLANLACGTMAAITIAQTHDQTIAVLLIFLAAFFDLLDGAVARKLGVHGEMGKQLDSLADVVSFGVAPSVIIWGMLERSLPEELSLLKYLALMNVICAAIRLARFNTAQSGQTVFFGMPSPANGIFWASMLAITAWENFHMPDVQLQVQTIWPAQLVLTLTTVSSLLMVSSVRMFSFKMKPGGISANVLPYSFLLLSATILCVAVTFLQNIFMAGPMIIIAYVLFSAFTHVAFKQQ